MKSNSNRNLLVGVEKKAVSLAACAFFLCLTSAKAQNNELSDIYKEVSSSVVSLSNGVGNAIILNPNTDKLEIGHDIQGFIIISNGFSSFSIDAAEKTLTASNMPVLSVLDGNNLNLSEGTFSGGSLNQSSNAWRSSIGLLMSNVDTGLITEASFSGTTITGDASSPPIPGEALYTFTNASGSAGMVMLSSSNITVNSSSAVGGNAAYARQIGNDIIAVGGTGLEIYSSEMIISNSTFTGGDGGTAISSGEYKAIAAGGDGIYASNSTINIKSGTFSGGKAGRENGIAGIGGSGLFAADGSEIIIEGGTFSGETALWIQDSALTTYGGDYSVGGLYSLTTETATNQINLEGGRFSSLKFINLTSNGFQNVTLTNTLVINDVYQEGGTVEITHYDDSALQEVVIDSGSMLFNNDLSLNGAITLITKDSSAVFKNNLTVTDGGEINAIQGSIHAAGNINFETGSSINFLVLTNQSGRVSAEGSIDFGTNSSFLVDASLAGFSSGVVSRTFMTSTNGISGFDTNLVDAEIIVSVNTNVESRTATDFDLSNPNEISVIFDTESLAEYWGATNGQFGALAAELEDLATPEMNIIINNLGSEQSAKLVEDTYFTTLNTFQVAKQGLDAAVGLSLSRGTEFRDQLMLPSPKGPSGPSLDPQNDWRFWMKYYGNFYSRGDDGLNSEYDATMHGGVIGMDRSFGNLLVGLAGGMGNYKIDAQSGAEQKMNAFQGALYSTYGFGHSYIDAGLAYGYNDVDSTTASPFSLEGTFDTHLLSGHLGGGIGFDIPKISTVITPEASLRFTTYEQGEYTESGGNAAPRSFESFDSESLVGMIGLNAGMLNKSALEYFAFKIEGRAHWMREFNPEPGELNYQLVGGANDYTIIYPFLDEDTIRLGVGFTFFNTQDRKMKNILLRLDFDELFGEDFNSHNLSAKVIYAF